MHIADTHHNDSSLSVIILNLFLYLYSVCTLYYMCSIVKSQKWSRCNSVGIWNR